MKPVGPSQPALRGVFFSELSLKPGESYVTVDLLGGWIRWRLIGMSFSEGLPAGPGVYDLRV